MSKTDTAQQAAAAATPESTRPDISLLSPEGYRRHYGEALTATGDKVAAWERTEQALQRDFGLRRFLSYQSFEVTFCKIRAGKIKDPKRLKFQYVGHSTN